jgi:cytochrome c
LKAIDVDVLPDGRGLPSGSGTAAGGKDAYIKRCLTCHGPTGTEGPQDVLSGGQGSLKAATPASRPLKTVGSYWPYATTLWDYIRRAMPFDHPGTLSTEEVYGTTAYVLYLNGIVGEHDVLSETTLPQVRMPNRDGFVPDPRPDVHKKK